MSRELLEIGVGAQPPFLLGHEAIVAVANAAARREAERIIEIVEAVVRHQMLDGVGQRNLGPIAGAAPDRRYRQVRVFLGEGKDLRRTDEIVAAALESVEPAHLVARRLVLGTIDIQAIQIMAAAMKAKPLKWIVRRS